MKMVGEAIEVCCRDGRPHRIVWRGRRYGVRQVTDRQEYAGKWWLDGGLHSRARRYYLVEVESVARHTLHLEIFAECGSWQISRVMD